MTGKTAVYNEGETIYSPFSKDRQVFVIKAGYVLAYSLEDDGKKRIHLIYGPDSYFPVITTFKNKPQRASYEALTRVAVVKYPVQEFVDRINNDLQWSNQILQKTVSQLRVFANIVINLHTVKLETKLFNLLKNLADDHGQKVAGGCLLPYKLKHHHLADMLGAERESVSRALNRLKARHLVKANKDGHLVIMVTDVHS